MNRAQIIHSAVAQQSISFPLPAAQPERNQWSQATGVRTGARQNALLKALPDDDLTRLLEHLELVNLPFGKYILECGNRLEHCYFPSSAVISLVYVMKDGATTELAVVGGEGVVGVSLFDGERATSTAIVQHGGYAYRLKSRYLREAFMQGGALPGLLMRHSNVLFMQMAQTVVGGQHFTVEQKVARWLLEHLDRSHSTELKATHAIIADMLGVRRESVTMIAGRLQDAGLIQYRRGYVTVIDRVGLQRQASQCSTKAETTMEAGGQASRQPMKYRCRTSTTHPEPRIHCA